MTATHSSKIRPQGELNPVMRRLFTIISFNFSTFTFQLTNHDQQNQEYCRKALEGYTQG